MKGQSEGINEVERRDGRRCSDEARETLRKLKLLVPIKEGQGRN